MDKKYVLMGALMALVTQVAAFLLPLVKLSQKFRFLTLLTIFGIFVLIAVIDIAVMALVAVSKEN